MVLCTIEPKSPPHSFTIEKDKDIDFKTCIYNHFGIDQHLDLPRIVEGDVRDPDILGRQSDRLHLNR